MNSSDPPVDSLISELQDAYQRLDALWESIEADLHKYRTPLGASIFLNESDGERFQLAFMRYGKNWRVCLIREFQPNTEFPDDDDGEQSEPAITPIKDVPFEDRIAFLTYVPKLQDAVRAAAKDAIAKINQAIEAATF